MLRYFLFTKVRSYFREMRKLDTVQVACLTCLAAAYGGAVFSVATSEAARRDRALKNVAAPQTMEQLIWRELPDADSASGAKIKISYSMRVTDHDAGTSVHTPTRMPDECEREIAFAVAEWLEFLSRRSVECRADRDIVAAWNVSNGDHGSLWLKHLGLREFRRSRRDDRDGRWRVPQTRKLDG